MPSSPYSHPILLRTDKESQSLRAVPSRLVAGGAISGAFDEKWLQDTLFEHPESLPTGEIDPAFRDLVPLCCELSTESGPLDILYVTPEGRIVIVETKLWKNSTARREVVAQVLDYAEKLSRWSYEKLDAQVRKAPKSNGEGLFDLVRRRYVDADEARFIDSVSETLASGRFMLLIVGDGIRSGVRDLTSFFDDYASLEFVFGLVEVAVYDIEDVGRLILPRILARTEVFRRLVIKLSDPRMTIEEVGEQVTQPPSIDPTWAAKSEFYRGYWQRFLKVLKLSDPAQEMARPGKAENIFFAMPPNASQAWVSAYFAQATKVVGVYLRFGKNADMGREAKELLQAERKAIEAELGVPTEWKVKEGVLTISASMSYLELQQDLAKIDDFFLDRIDRFTRVFRPRLQVIAETLLKP